MTIFLMIVFGLTKWGYDSLKSVAYSNDRAELFDRITNWIIGIAITWLFLAILLLGSLKKGKGYDEWLEEQHKLVRFITWLILLGPAVLSVAIIFFGLFCSSSWWLFFAFFGSVIMMEMFYRKRKKRQSAVTEDYE